MTVKEFKICTSDTPSILASEVTELLSCGLRLYGHPFVGVRNGDPNSGDPICQAMVKENGRRIAPVAHRRSSSESAQEAAPPL